MKKLTLAIITLAASLAYAGTSYRVNLYRPTVINGTELKALTGIDDHSRFCVAAGLLERASARAVCGVFAQALRTHGVPDEVLTDNGKVFTGRYGPHPVEVLFDRICRENGITHRLTAVRAPTTTGKICEQSSGDAAPPGLTPVKV